MIEHLRHLKGKIWKRSNKLIRNDLMRREEDQHWASKRVTNGRRLRLSAVVFTFLECTTPSVNPNCGPQIVDHRLPITHPGWHTARHTVLVRPFAVHQTVHQSPRRSPHRRSHLTLAFHRSAVLSTVLPTALVGRSAARSAIHRASVIQTLYRSALENAHLPVPLLERSIRVASTRD